MNTERIFREMKNIIDAERDRFGEPEQVQCEFCYCTPNSIYNQRNLETEAHAS